jgi:hypothetical protein
MLAMVKETKFFRKQADKAERMARSATDVEISQQYLNMAQAPMTQKRVVPIDGSTVSHHAIITLAIRLSCSAVA